MYGTVVETDLQNLAAEASVISVEMKTSGTRVAALVLGLSGKGETHVCYFAVHSKLLSIPNTHQCCFHHINDGL